MFWMFHIRCSMCPSCCCTTHSRRRRHSLILFSMKLCESCMVLVVFLGSAATQLRWCYRPNYHFVRYKFLVVTVKKLLKSVFSTLSYAYTKKTPTFLAHPVYSVAAACDYSWHLTRWLASVHSRLQCNQIVRSTQSPNPQASVHVHEKI